MGEASLAMCSDHDGHIKSVRFGIFRIPFPDPSRDPRGFRSPGSQLLPLYRNTW